MRKPVRKVRRFFRQKLRRKGKGKGKRFTGKGLSAYVTSLSDEEYEETFFGKGKGKGLGKAKGKRSSGKGGGRKTNPRNKRGSIMECFGKGGKCKSKYHLKRDCPYERSGRPNRVPSRPNSPFDAVNYVESITDMFLVTTVTNTDAFDRADRVTWQVGYNGIVVGQASNPGPPKPIPPVFNAAPICGGTVHRGKLYCSLEHIQALQGNPVWQY